MSKTTSKKRKCDCCEAEAVTGTAYDSRVDAYLCKKCLVATIEFYTELYKHSFMEGEENING